MKRKGKRTAEWELTRAEIKKKFIAEGIYYCEFNFEGCWRIIQGFAHSLKRNKMGKWGTEEREFNLNEVVAACNICHDKIEGKEDMAEIIQRYIARRNQRRAKWVKIS